VGKFCSSKRSSYFLSKVLIRSNHAKTQRVQRRKVQC
jgi:hypothetical protein